MSETKQARKQQEETNQVKPLTMDSVDAIFRDGFEADIQVEQELVKQGGAFTRAGVLVSRTFRFVMLMMIDGVVPWICISFITLGCLDKLEWWHVLALTCVALAQLVLVGTGESSHGQKRHQGQPAPLQGGEGST